MQKSRKAAKLEKIAQEKSLDAGSKSKGGELDWSPAANYVQPFAEALTKLNKGKLTEQPVKTPFGWHVIRLDDVRPLKIPPLEEIKAESGATRTATAICGTCHGPSFQGEDRVTARFDSEQPPFITRIPPGHRPAGGDRAAVPVVSLVISISRFFPFINSLRELFSSCYKHYG